MKQAAPIQEAYYQLSLFENLQSKAGVMAVNRLTHDAVPTEELEPWMLKLVPDAVFAAKYAGHPLVLCRLKAADVKTSGFDYRYFLVDGEPYFSIYVG